MYKNALSVYGLYDKYKKSFIPLYIIDQTIQRISLIIPWIFLLFRIIFTKKSTKIFTIYDFMMNVIKKTTYDQRMINLIETYTEEYMITNTVVPVSFEESISMSFDLIRDYIYLNSKSFDFSDREFYNNLNSNIYFSNVDYINGYIREIVKKINKIYFDNYYLPRMTNNKDIIISYGNIDFHINKDIINISNINEDLYEKLISFIITSQKIEYFDLNYGKINGIIVNHGNELLKDIDIHILISHIQGIIDNFDHHDKIIRVVKSNNFTLFLITKNNIYHIDLMLIPLLTSTIVY